MWGIMNTKRNKLKFTPNPAVFNGNKFDTPVPDGVYEATISGYEVVFRYSIFEYSLESDRGVRGINIPCVVVVESGDFYLEL